MKDIEILSNYFYSNCLLEAIKAKLKNPKDVKVRHHRIKGCVLPHFVWETNGYLYDFATNHKIFSPLYFQGFIRRRKNAAD